MALKRISQYNRNVVPGAGLDKNIYVKSGDFNPVVDAVNNLIDGSISTTDLTLSGDLIVGDDATITGDLAVTGTTTLTGAVTQKANYILGSVAAPTYATPYALTSALSGSTVIFDVAAGSSFTLPAAGASVIGSYFDFIVKTTCTTNGHDIVCAGTNKMIGAVSMGVSATTPGANPGPKFFLGDGSATTKVAMAAASSNVAGGILGTQLRATCVSATQWQVTGIVIGAGTIVTPFA